MTIERTARMESAEDCGARQRGSERGARPAGRGALVTAEPAAKGLSSGELRRIGSMALIVFVSELL